MAQVTLAMSRNRPAKPKATGIFHSDLKVVGGAGFEPATVIM